MEDIDPTDLADRGSVSVAFAGACLGGCAGGFTVACPVAFTDRRPCLGPCAGAVAVSLAAGTDASGCLSKASTGELFPSMGVPSVVGLVESSNLPLDRVAGGFLTASDFLRVPWILTFSFGSTLVSVHACLGNA